MFFSDEQDMLRESIREFVRRDLPPGFARYCDENGHTPLEQYKRFADLGYLGIGIPEELGGQGGGIVEMTIVLEELAKGMMSFAALVYRSAVQGAQSLLSYGSEEQKSRLLPGLLSGDLLFCLSLSEPDSGSDAASLRLRAERDGDHYVLNGTKMWSSGAHIADYILLVARTSTEGPKHKGISLFLVDTKSPGLTVRRVPTIGERAVGTNEVSYVDVRVPVEMRLGEENQGWYLLQLNLEKERLCLATWCTGAAQDAFDQSLAYAKVRKQFDHPIGSFQAIQHRLAEMAMELHQARLLIYDLAGRIERKERARKEASMTKAFCTEMSNRIAYQALQIFGGYGYAMESDMQLLMRDARIMTIGGGSSEIMRNIIAKELGLPSS